LSERIPAVGSEPVELTGLDVLPAAAASAQLQQRRQLRHGLISVALLIALAAGLLLAVPGLHGIASRLGHMSPGLVVLAVSLEFLSCFGYVLAFMLVFDRAPLLFAARVAWSEMAFGAVVAFGGAGSLAIGAWILTQRGAPAGRVAQRSAVLFLLTSAINVITLIVFGLGLGVRIFDGPSNPLQGWLPGGVGVAVIVFFLALPPIMDRRTGSHSPGRIAALLEGSAESTRDAARLLVTPDWRLLGAVGYLLFDIAVLWLCLDAAGHPLPFATVVLAYQIGYLSNIIPIPGSIGILDGSLVGMLILYGAGATAAAAATVVYHAIALWIPALGAIPFVRLQRAANRPLTLRPPKAERQQLRQRNAVRSTSRHERD